MEKSVKIVLWLAAAVAALILAAVIVLPLIIDPNDFKPQIEGAVKKNTGRDIRIVGDLHLSVFPWLGVETGKVSLSNAPGFGERPFAAVETADVKVKLIPLLSKKLEVNRIVLNGLELNLLIDAEGNNNWSDLTGPKDSDGTGAPTPEDDPRTVPAKEPAQEKPATAAPSIALAGVTIKDSRVSWDNRQTGEHYDVRDLNLHTEDLVFDTPIGVDLAFTLTSEKPKLTESLKLSTDLIIDESFETIRANKLKAVSLTGGESLQGGELNADIHAPKLAFDSGRQILDIPDLKIKSSGKGLMNPDSTLSADLSAAVNLDLNEQILRAGNLKLTSSSKALALPDTVVDGELSAAVLFDMAKKTLKVDELALKAGGKGKVLPGGSLAGDLVAAAINLNLDRQTLEVSDFHIDAEELSISGRLSGTHILDEPRVNGPITVARFNPRNLMQKLDIEPPQTTDPNALTRLAAQMDLQAGSNQIGLNNLTLALDDSNIKGSSTFGKLDESTPAITFDLAVDALDADRYLPPKTKKKEKATKPETPKLPSATTPAATVAAPQGKTSLFPVETLRQLDLTGTLTIGQFKIQGLAMQDVRLQVDGKNGLIHSKQKIGRFYQGSYQGSHSLDVRNSPPQLTIDDRLSGVQVGPLQRDLGRKTVVTGTADVAAKIRGRGDSVDAIKASLSGNVDGRLRDGIIKGFNLQKIVDQAKTQVNRLKGKETEPQTSESDETEFTEISLTAVLINGRVRNDDLLARSRLLQVNGKGDIHLAHESIDYKVIARLLKDSEKIRGIPVAIKVGGTFDKPRYRLSLEDMLKEEQKAVIEEKKEELLEKLDKKLEKKLGPGGASGLLKKLF